MMSKTTFEAWRHVSVAPTSRADENTSEGDDQAKVGWRLDLTE